MAAAEVEVMYPVATWAAVAVPVAFTAFADVGVWSVMKPFKDTTGPENVVRAMIFPYIQVKCISLYVVSRDCLMHRISPDYCVYITVFLSAQQLFFLSQFFGIIHA